MAGPGDIAAQIFARLGTGVTKPAATLTDLIGLDKTAANLRARTQLLEDIIPTPERGIARVGAHAVESLPSTLAFMALTGGFAKGLGPASPIRKPPLPPVSLPGESGHIARAIANRAPSAAETNRQLRELIAQSNRIIQGR